MIKILYDTYDSGIYCILNLDTGKMYFGLTRQFSIRSKWHIQQLKVGKHCNDYLQKVYNKGQNLVCFLVEECATNKLREREVFWISYHQSNIRNNGYNLTAGGEDLGNLSQESKLKRAQNRKGKGSSLKGKSQSIEWINAITIKTKGQKRSYTPEHLTSIRNAMRARVGTRKSGLTINIIDNIGNSIILNSRREAEDFLQIKRDSLIHKFYRGKSPNKIRLTEIQYNNYTIKEDHGII